jgi:hypothetical protein
MATVLDRRPMRPETLEEQLSAAPAAPVAPVGTSSGDKTTSVLPQHASVHDDIAALLLGLGEWGALVHGAVWEALLGPLANHGKDAEPPAPHARHQTPHPVPPQ